MSIIIYKNTSTTVLLKILIPTDNWIIDDGNAALIRAHFCTKPFLSKRENEVINLSPWCCLLLAIDEEKLYRDIISYFGRKHIDPRLG